MTKYRSASKWKQSAVAGLRIIKLQIAWILTWHSLTQVFSSQIHVLWSCVSFWRQSLNALEVLRRKISCPQFSCLHFEAWTWHSSVSANLLFSVSDRFKTMKRRLITRLMSQFWSRKNSRRWKKNLNLLRYFSFCIFRGPKKCQQKQKQCQQK